MALPLCQYGRGESGVRLWPYLSASMDVVSWELDCGPTSLSVWAW